MKAFYTIILLLLANIFMTLAWYGHLKLNPTASGVPPPPLYRIILMSWGIAFFEYCIQVPANRIGYIETGGPFNLWQLKVIQEALTLIVFTFFAVLVFKNEVLRWNHLVGFSFLILAVYFIFKK